MVGLALDDDGIPATAAGRLAVAEKIIARAAECGIEKRNIIIDPLALTISTGPDNAAVDLEVIRKLTEQKIKTIMGVSNISFGLPSRDAVNSTFSLWQWRRGFPALLSIRRVKRCWMLTMRIEL